jgi:hypothetical protein
MTKKTHAEVAAEEFFAAVEPGKRRDVARFIGFYCDLLESEPEWQRVSPERRAEVRRAFEAEARRVLGDG